MHAEVRRGGFPSKLCVFFFLVFCVFGVRSGPDGSRQAVGFIWVLFGTKPPILNPFRANLMILDQNRTLVSRDWTWADLDRLWPILADFGRPWAKAWADLGPTLGRLWADFGPTLG